MRKLVQRTQVRPAIALLLLCALCFSFQGCGGGEPARPRPELPGGEQVLGLQLEGDLGPVLTATADSASGPIRLLSGQPLTLRVRVLMPDGAISPADLDAALRIGPSAPPGSSLEAIAVHEMAVARLQLSGSIPDTTSLTLRLLFGSGSPTRKGAPCPRTRSRRGRGSSGPCSRPRSFGSSP